MTKGQPPTKIMLKNNPKSVNANKYSKDEG